MVSMSTPIWTSILGFLCLSYLLSFVLLAIIRIATGLSVQRIGYLSLKRIAYAINDALKIEIRDLSVQVHRPTYARPTWITLRLRELKITVEASTPRKEGQPSQSQNAPTTDKPHASQRSPRPLRHPFSGASALPVKLRSLSELKEALKRSQTAIQWLRFVDLELLDAIYSFGDVCSLQLESCVVAVDTRQTIVERGRLFRHKRVSTEGRQPAEWAFILKKLLYLESGKHSIELLDMCIINIHGFFHNKEIGLRDTSVSMKLGRVYIPYDNIVASHRKISRSRLGPNDSKTLSLPALEADNGHIEERPEQISQDAQGQWYNLHLGKLLASVLAGVQEVQIAASFVGMSTEVRLLEMEGSQAYMNVAMNEFGIDLFRLDPTSPAHRMYFPEDNMAHQALLAAISIAVSLDAGKGKPDRLIYIPMATTTIKSTLPSRSVQYLRDRSEPAHPSIAIGNLVLTSPSLDVDLSRMPSVLALLQGHQGPVQTQLNGDRHWSPGQVLLRISIKVSIQEPVARIVLPRSDTSVAASCDYDMLVLCVSSISLELESLQAPSTEPSHSLSSTVRITSHHLYYQTAVNQTYTVLLLDSFEVKSRIFTEPDVSALVTCSLESFSAHLVRPEIVKGIGQVFCQLQNIQYVAKHSPQQSPVSHGSRSVGHLPKWLSHVRFETSNTRLEVARVDHEVSSNPHGVSVQIGAWDLIYAAHDDVALRSRHPVHRSATGYHGQAETTGLRGECTTPVLPRTQPGNRQFTSHLEGFKCLVATGPDQWDPLPFISSPKLDMSFGKVKPSDNTNLTVNANVKAIFVDYSLFKSYSLLTAFEVTQSILSNRTPSTSSKKSAGSIRSQPLDSGYGPSRISRGEKHSPNLVGKIALVQIKAELPRDPPMLLRMSGLEAQWPGGAPKCFKTKLVRLCTKVPRVQGLWSRVILCRNLRMNLDRLATGPKDGPSNPLSVEVVSTFCRFAVPHQVVVHQIIDNVTDVTKATMQLRARNQSARDRVDKPRPRAPRLLPKVSFRSKVLLFELEDGLFDWKLGMIYRVGLSEQKQRLAREEAFRIKEKRLHFPGQRRDASRYRHRFSAPPDQVAGHRSSRPSAPGSRERVKPDGANDQHPARSHARKMRYDSKSLGSLSDKAAVDASDAWSRLQAHNASNWQRRIDFAANYQMSASRDMRYILGDVGEPYDRFAESDRILNSPQHPALLAVIISDLHLLVDKPTFPIEDYPQYLSRIGKGIPTDTEYSLLILTSVHVNMGDTRLSLRNYPLPMLHVPRLRSEQSQRLPAWSVKGDFVVAEEFHGVASSRHVPIRIVPCSQNGQQSGSKGLSVEVRRTISPVKTYSEIDVSIYTRNPTGITWGTSYQPAIQDMMQVIEKFTKARVNSSQSVGFWDKIRLVFHSRIQIAWKGNGDVHLRLKGSRDPYVVSGHGAGFVMCFRDDVKWEVHQVDDPKKFMTVSCNEYILAIPNYSHQARLEFGGPNREHDDDPFTNGQLDANPHFKKVVMKLSGYVRWLAGLVFERNLEEGGHSFDFTPHFDVVFKESANGAARDALSGFRSHNLHLSLAVVAPVERDWSINNSRPSSGYNSMHTSPRFFTHFFDWWSLFSGVMSIPIRQGRLFAESAKTSKKFSRHLATIKYNLLLSPFLVSHVYKHGAKQGSEMGTVGITGLKIRIDSFLLDLHQRREEFAMQGKGRLKILRTSGMRINQAQLDFISADVRAMSARTKDAASFFSEELSSPMESPVPSETSQADSSSWFDIDDFVELGETASDHSPINTQIMPLAFSPRFTYLRQTDNQSIVGQDVQGTSHFGNENTHYCIMSSQNDPRIIQREIMRERYRELWDQLEDLKLRIGEAELNVLRSISDNAESRQQLESLQESRISAQSRLQFLEEDLELRAPEDMDASATLDGERPGVNKSFEDAPDKAPSDGESSLLSRALPSGSFKNCFIIHNVQLKWNNALRDTVLHYAHQVNQRRGFVYYMSRRAVKFIIDIVHEQQHTDRTRQGRASRRSHASLAEGNQGQESRSSLEARINDILSDGKESVDADDPRETHANPSEASTGLGQVSSEEFATHDSYHLRLIAPQIQLQSRKNSENAVLVTASEMELRVVQIMDKDRISDDVSGLVQRRFSLDMEGVQFFVTDARPAGGMHSMDLGVPYGAAGHSNWPPWAPLETNFDFEANPLGLARIVQKTSASLRYDKYNTLRLKYNSELGESGQNGRDAVREAESRLDHLWVKFPHIRAICDSSQYYTAYVIVLDLLLYSEPLEKVRNERLEKIMLAADFSDLSGSAEMVGDLQRRIRDLDEIKSHFQLHTEDLDEQGKQDLVMIESDLSSCEDELFFLMKAITSSQRKYDEHSPDASSNALLRWYLSASEVVWLMVKDGIEPLVEIQLRQATYERTDNSDGSNLNVMEIQQIRGLNLLSNATYPEIVAPFFESSLPRESFREEDIKMFKVRWYMLEAVAGIPVLDQFEINLFPIRLQIEREIGDQLLDYIFPGHKHSLDVPPTGANDLAGKAQGNSNDSTDKTLTYDERKAGKDTVQPTISSSGLLLPPTHDGQALNDSRQDIATSVPQTRSFTSISRVLNRSRERIRDDAKSVRFSDRASVSSLSISRPGSEGAQKTEMHRSGKRDEPVDGKNASDDLTEMVARASNFMTLAYVKIPSVVLCLSFKGRNERNFTDIHDLVFRMPSLEYRNKTWSNLDLVMRLKKDVIKALISHTGAIIGNKLSRHRSDRGLQGGLADTATSSSVMLDRHGLSEASSRTSSSVLGRRSSDASQERGKSSVANWLGAIPGLHPTRSSAGHVPGSQSNAPRPGPVSTPSTASYSSSTEQL